MWTTQEVETAKNIPDSSALPVIVVPARLGSTRFPQKLLAEVKGKPLILWTAERIAEAAPEFALHFAVDGSEIGDILKNSGFSVVETDPSLASGTDRIAFANREIQAEAVINVQGDEPRIERSHILALVAALSKTGAEASTLAVPFRFEEDFLDENQVKVVRDSEGYALYFSRSPIPFDRSHREAWSEKFPQPRPLKHLGLYAYKASFLECFSGLPPGALEEREKLEQLRALECGFKIAVSVVESETLGIDVPADLVSFARLVESE